MLHKSLLALGFAFGAMSLSAPAQAAPIFFNLTAPSGTFTSNPVACDAGPAGCAGAFTASGSFSAPAGYEFVQGTISTNAINALTNLNLSSVMLNGQSFSLFSPNAGVFEFGGLTPISLLSTNTLVVSGYTGGAGAFSGDLTFAAGAVPEPATWAMMLLGFAGIGSVARRRRNTEVRAHLQMA
jgi:hypothetical protein